MVIFGLVLFGTIGYVVADQYAGIGWVGAVVGLVVVLIVAAFDLGENN